MVWNGNVTGSTVNSTPSEHGPKEMDRVNRWLKDIDLEADPDGSVAGPIRTRTIFRDGKIQLITAGGHLATLHTNPSQTNNIDITLPADTTVLGSGGGGSVNDVDNIGLGIGIFKQLNAGVAELYSITSLSNAIEIALNAGSDIIEFTLNQSQININNLGGSALTIAKGGTGNTTANSAYAALSPMTTNGDLIYRTGGIPARLPIGLEGYVLTVVSGLPAWQPSAGGGGGGAASDLTLFRNSTVVDIVNNAAESNLFSFTVPGGKIGDTGVVKIIVTGSYLNDSGSDDQYDIRLKFGGVTIWQDSSGTQSSTSNRRPVYIELYIKNNNSASSQRVGGTFVNGNAVLGDVGISDISDDEIRGESPIQASASINTSADQTLALTIDHADADPDISFRADIISVELLAGSTGAAGEANTTSNEGTGEGTLALAKSGVNLPFKTLKQGTNITITNNANDVTIAASGSVGEANTASNQGTGEGTLAMTKSGVDLPFKTLKQGTNITITNNANDVTIAASGGGGSGGGIMEDFASGGIAWGWQYPHGIIGGGILNNVASDIVEANVSVVYSNTANKGYGRRITGIDGGAEGNSYLGKVSLPFRRELDCFVDFWMQIGALSGSISCKIYAFFTDDSTPASTSDTPLDSQTGFGIMAQDGGNLRRVSNDGSASQQLHGSDLFTKDNTLRHIRIESDTTNSKWIITVDGTPTDYTYASIQGPAASTQMYFCFNVDESGGSDDQVLDIYKFKCGYKLP